MDHDRMNSGRFYDDQARSLFKRLNLPEDGSGTFPGRYNKLDVIWQHPRTGAKVYVGNHSAAADAALLSNYRISHIVNCQDVSTENFFEGKPGYSYKRFPISYWRVVRDISNPAVVKAYFEDVFGWVDAAVGDGKSVLIHCLAGAHRAGTTGVAYLMRAANLSSVEAIRAAKQLRPAIDPIADFPQLLRYYEKGLSLQPRAF